MNLSSNIKDTLTSVAGVLAAIAGVIITMASTGTVLPSWVTVAGGILGSLAAAIIGFVSGKNPNLSTKSAVQVKDQNAQAKP